MALEAGPGQRRQSLLVGLVGVGAFAEQELHDAQVALGGGGHQRRPAGAVRLLHRGAALLQQRLGHLPVALLDGADQRRHVLERANQQSGHRLNVRVQLGKTREPY